MTARTSTLIVIALAAGGVAAASCAFDSAGTNDEYGAEPLDAAGSSDLGADTTYYDAGSECDSKSGIVCFSPGKCHGGTYDCSGACNADPDPVGLGNDCTISGCPGKIVCTGDCEPLPSGDPCKPTKNGCDGRLACDKTTCVDVDKKIGTACDTILLCPSTYDCAGKCNDAPGARTPCSSATCGLVVVRDCAGVCPDPKPGDTTKSCHTCYKGTTAVLLYFDVCNKCKTCSDLGYTEFPPDAGTDTGTDTSIIDTGTDTSVTDTHTDTSIVDTSPPDTRDTSVVDTSD